MIIIILKKIIIKVNVPFILIEKRIGDNKRSTLTFLTVINDPFQTSSYEVPELFLQNSMLFYHDARQKSLHNLNLDSYNHQQQHLTN